MRTPATRRSERGFSLVEALIAIAILSGALLAFTSAMLGSTHATTRLVSRQTLTDAASDVLTDIKVAAAYQPEVLTSLAVAPPQPFTIVRTNAAGDPVSITVAERFRRAGASVKGWIVGVTASSGDHTESLEQLVVQQAAAPGSTVTAEPTSDAVAADSRAGGDILGASSASSTGGAVETTDGAPPVAGASTSAPLVDGSAGAAAGCIDDGSCWPRGGRPIAR